MFKNFRRLNIKNFCEKLDKNEKRISDYTYLDIKNFIAEAESNINNGTYFINSIPDNNYFSEVPIYIAPNSSINKLKLNELNGIIYSGTFFTLAYSKIFFENMFFIPFFGIMTLTTIFRYLRSSKLLDTQVLRITLVDEGKVKITYCSGKTEIVNIKSVQISPSFSDQLASLDDKKMINQKKMIERENSSINNNLKIAINVDSNTCGLVIKSGGMASKMTNDDVSYLNTKILFGIISKKTKKLSLKES